MPDEYAHTRSPSGAEPPEPPPRPAFFNRLWMVFVQPGELFKALAANPAWFPVALLCGLVVGLVMSILPTEFFRDAAVQNLPPGQAADQQLPPIVYKAIAVGGAALGALIIPVLFSLATYVIFVFIRGDRGTFKQHLCVIAHTRIITSVGTVANTLVWLRSGDMTRTLAVGTFFPFLSEGFFAEFLQALDLFMLWAVAVVGIGLAEIDPRRRAGSTAAVLLGIAVVVLLGIVALVRAAIS